VGLCPHSGHSAFYRMLGAWSYSSRKYFCSPPGQRKSLPVRSCAWAWDRGEFLVGGLSHCTHTWRAFQLNDCSQLDDLGKTLTSWSLSFLVCISISPVLQGREVRMEDDVWRTHIVPQKRSLCPRSLTEVCEPHRRPLLVSWA
jgi:hypothetical protein